MLSKTKSAAGGKEIKIYFAASLFTQAERIWNRMLKKALEKEAKTKGLKIKILFPQDVAEEIMGNEKLSHNEKMDAIYEALHNNLVKTNIVLAILDGPDSDSGTSAEAYAGKIMSKKVIGVRTDFREAGEENGLNLMLAKACDKIITFPAFNESVEKLAKEIFNKIIELCINSQ